MITADDIVVIAAVDNLQILEACLKRSPDVQSGRIPVVTVEGARSMAEAYNEGMSRTSRSLCIFAHQDVYFPVGWVDLALERLNALTAQDPMWQVAGPYGVRPDGIHAGRIWDVGIGRELGAAGFAPTPVGSLDELALIVRRDDAFHFDPALPHFHLYGTDLVQSALARGRTAYAVELPMVHNSRLVATLRGGYWRAYHYTRRKWARKLPIYTTVCRVTNNPLALWRAQWVLRKVAPRPPGLLADAVDVARLAGYETASG